MTLPWLCLYLLAGTSAYPFYQERIPNGNKVPHPCNPNILWPGVGHVNPGGGGTRNPFGETLEAAREQWNREICEADSDGDGLTNGQELGDPDCTWEPGQTLSAANLSHPGVCEPVDSDLCKDSPFKFTCDGGVGEECDAVDDDDVFLWPIQFPESQVPDKETNYFCQTYEVPVEYGSVHAVAFEPIIDNIDVLHHILVWGCTGNVVATETPERCGMIVDGCPDLLTGWGWGQGGYCLNEDVGIALGQGGYTHLSLQIHWNNPEFTPGLVDASGYKVYLTNELRELTEQMSIIGQMYLEVPPLSPVTLQSGFCDEACTNHLLPHPVYFTSGNIHMHYLGLSGQVDQYRGGELVRTIMYDSYFDYDTPVRHVFNPPIEFLPGDEIKVDCYFNSLDGNRWRNTTTYFGEATSDEMCFTFISYYPALEQGRTFDCTQAGGGPRCGLVVKDLLVLADYLDTSGLCHTCDSTCRHLISHLLSSPCAQTLLSAAGDVGHMDSLHWAYNQCLMQSVESIPKQLNSDKCPL